MQYVYTVAIIILLAGIFSIPEIVKEKKSIRWITLFLFSFSGFIFYLFATKRMFFNPILTLQSKLNLLNNIEHLENYNISVIYLIAIFLLGNLIWYIYAQNSKASYLYARGYFLISSIFFLGFSFLAYFDSFSRISNPSPNLLNQINFLTKIIFPAFFGKFSFIGIGLVFLAFVFFVYYALKKKKITLELFSLLAVFLFPLFFILSSVPLLTGTARYFISWWPHAVISIVFLCYKLSQKNKIISLFVAMLLAYWIYYFAFILTNFVKNYSNEREAQKKYNLEIIDKITKEGLKFCEGDYWRIGPIMFDSKLSVKCFADKKETGADYLDFYKERISVGEKVYKIL
jgi:hypothetical protein